MNDDGGPAFPVEYVADQGSEGMSLRDYFAGQSLGELVSGLSYPVSDVDAEAVAKDAYKLADAMIREKEKGEQNHA